ncbi:MAG: DUF2192 domain-containing protein [Thermoproteales archaeon]|nr:DUF2192 domain-containing protein [Thermoproteales archaeon]
MQRLHKDRIEIALNLWSKVVKGEIKTRNELVSKLKTQYIRNRIEPIRGKTKINIFDKELATVFLVGKYGLGLEEEEYKEKFESLFKKETLCEKAIEEIIIGKNPREVINRLFGNINEDIIFRILRLQATGVFLEFKDEDTLVKLINIFEKAFPEYAKKIEGFKKFYIAFKMAEQIAGGNIRNRIEKETLKHALCLKFNALKSAPSDSFVREIATQVLKAEEFKVNDTLSMINIEAELS